MEQKVLLLSHNLNGKKYWVVSVWIPQASGVTEPQVS